MERLNRYLVKWCEMAGYDDDYDGLTRSRAAEIVKWGDSQEMAFNEIKHLLSSEPILKLPDLNKEFILQTDASNKSFGGCLLQEHVGVRHPVLYASRKLLPREQNYSVGEREALVVSYVVYFRRIFLRNWKTMHFSKLDGISNQNTNVSICTGIHMAAI